MRHHATVSREPVLFSRQLSLLPVLQPWEGCDFPSCHSPRSNVLHDANACTTHCLQELGEPCY